MISMMINLGFSAFMNVLSQVQDELPETASMQETSLPTGASTESTPEAGDVVELTPEMQAAISTEWKKRWPKRCPRLFYPPECISP